MSAWSSIKLMLRIYVFIFIFIVDVRVRAEDAADQTTHQSVGGSLRRVDLPVIQQQPENCWLTDSACAVRTHGGQSARGEWNGGMLSLDETTTLVRNSPKALRLVTGTIWVKDTQRASVLTEFGRLEWPKAVEAIIQKNEDRITVSVIRGVVEIHPVGSGEHIEVAAGFENWLGRVDGTGRAQTGIPTSVVFSPFLQKWGRLYVGKKPEFEKEATEFYSLWREASEEAAVLHRELFLRKCASIDADEKQREASRQKVRARERELLAKFRHHVFEE